MKQKKDWIQAREALRAKADQAFSSLSLAGTMAKPAETMMHELLVHKFELEMQVEELKRAADELEEARDRYLEYYECAPIGYFTLDRTGRIAESNLTAAALLGVERSAQAGERFAHFVSSRDQDHWHRVFLKITDDPDTAQLAVVLQIARVDRTTFDAYLDCRCLRPAEGSPTVRVTLFDIAKIRQAEKQAAGETETASVSGGAQ